MAPAYFIQFDGNWWRICHQDYCVGEYDSAEAAARVAIRIAQSSLLGGLKTQVILENDGSEVLWDPDRTEDL